MDTAIPASNVGYRLLQRLGWRPGGGLGREQQGRVDPVRLDANDTGTRTGLGRKEVGRLPRLSAPAAIGARPRCCQGGRQGGPACVTGAAGGCRCGWWCGRGRYWTAEPGCAAPTGRVRRRLAPASLGCPRAATPSACPCCAGPPICWHKLQAGASPAAATAPRFALPSAALPVACLPPLAGGAPVHGCRVCGAAGARGGDPG